MLALSYLTMGLAIDLSNSSSRTILKGITLGKILVYEGENKKHMVHLKNLYHTKLGLSEKPAGCPV